MLITSEGQPRKGREPPNCDVERVIVGEGEMCEERVVVQPMMADMDVGPNTGRALNDESPALVHMRELQWKIGQLLRDGVGGVRIGRHVDGSRIGGQKKDFRQYLHRERFDGAGVVREHDTESMNGSDSREGAL